MLIAAYGIILLVFWILALRIEPWRYPEIPEEIVWAWRARKLNYYRRYAGLLLIWIVLAISNGVLFSHPEYLIWARILVVITACFMSGTLMYIAYQTWQNHLWKRQYFRK